MSPTLHSKRRKIIASLAAIAFLVVVPALFEKKSLSSFSWISGSEEYAVASSPANGSVDTHPSHRENETVVTNHLQNATIRGPGPLDDTGLRRQINLYFDHAYQGASDHEWIREYFLWHCETRETFPDVQLFDDPKGPNITILYVDPDKHKGGLTDRMKGIGHALLRAHEQKRLLLFKWYDAPLPLESFVFPHLLNFTVPDHPSTATLTSLTSSYEGSKGRVILYKFDSPFGNYLQPYGLIWHALFKPSAPVQAAIDHTKATLGLVPGEYDAVHARVGHPAFQNKVKYQTDADRDRDRGSGLKFEGVNRVATLAAGIRGIECVEWAAKSKNYTTNDNRNQTIYFYADSSDLVKAVVSPESLNARDEEQLSLVEHLKKLGSRVKIVGRQDAAITHLQNRNVETPTDAFLSTFVDLYIAAEARCIALGVGRFAYMAAKISGTTCWTMYQIPKSSVISQWGMKLMSQEVPNCPHAPS